MKNVLVFAVLTLSAVLASCSKPAAPPATPPAAASQAAPVRQAPPKNITPENQGILTDTQRDGLNGANQVSDVLKKADEERRKQMKEQGL